MVFATRILKRLHSYFENQTHVKLYARYRPAWPENVSRAVIDYASKVVPQDRMSKLHLVDVGCGSGQSTPMYAPYCKKIMGIDPSAEQINHAIGANVHGNIEYKVGHGECIPLPNDSMDIVCCAQAAHWMDHHAFFEECRRVLRRCGCMAVYWYTMDTLTVPGEKFKGHCHELYKNVLRRCDFHPRVTHLFDHISLLYDDLPSTEKSIQRTIKVHSEWGLSDLEGYIKSLSGYRKLLEAGQENNLLQTLLNEVIHATGKSDSSRIRVDIDWSVLMILSICPDI